jgi:hypothetical protein
MVGLSLKPPCLCRFIVVNRQIHGFRSDLDIVALADAL